MAHRAVAVIRGMVIIGRLISRALHLSRGVTGNKERGSINLFEMNSKADAVSIPSHDYALPPAPLPCVAADRLCGADFAAAISFT